jgi:hypothetical protein
MTVGMHERYLEERALVPEAQAERAARSLPWRRRIAPVGGTT